MSIEDQPKLFLELGQIIQINAPSNTSIHEHIYYIKYLDDKRIKLIDNVDLSLSELHIKDNKITDESIETIAILAKPNKQGYAQQNELTPDKWISIHFGGDIPTIINGQITDLEEDMIELTTYPGNKTIYIDFEYKGLPQDLFIDKITPFTPPKKLEEAIRTEEKEEEELVSLDEEEELTEDLELILETEFEADDIFINIEDIVVGEKLGEITEQVDVDEAHRRYGLDAQTNDLLDELLSSIPTHERTSKVLNNIHIIIERFKQLRRKFSTFDEEGNAETIKKRGAGYKPLVKKLLTLNEKLLWLFPIVKNRHKLYNINVSYDESYPDITQQEYKYVMTNEMEIIEQYRKNTVPDGENKYNYLFRELNPYFTPFVLPDNNQNIITIKQVTQNLDTVIDNLDDFYATMLLEDWGFAKKNRCPSKITSSRFVIDRYNLGLNRLENPDLRNKKSKSLIVPLTAPDRLALKGFLTLPEIFLRYSHINLPNTSILDKVNLHMFNFNYFQILNVYTEIEQLIINENQEEKKQGDKTTDKNYFKKFRAYTFEEMRNYVDRGSSDEVYETFLNNIIPRTRVLFELIKKYIKNGTSYIKVIEYLEPFLIYTDDISFKQYQAITNFIDDEIIKHKQTIIKNIALFKTVLSKYKSYNVPTILPKLLDREYSTLIFPEGESRDGYGSLRDMATEITLKRIITYDAGRTFNAALTLSELTFAQPIDIEEKIDQELRDATEYLETRISNQNCKNLLLAKKYNDIDEIQTDNNTEIFFDHKYDQTPYDIGLAWFDKKGDNLPTNETEIIQELTTFLIANNGITKQKAERDAEAMHLKAKRVKDGDYAILDLGDADYKYYIRTNNSWKLDRDLTGRSIDEIENYFCNMKKSCIKVKETCTNIDVTKQQLKKNLLDDITKRFEDEYKEGIATIKINVKEDFRYHLSNLSNLKKLKTHENIKYNLEQIKIAETLEIRDFIISPYADLRDNMLSQPDLIKRFADINIFIDKFCEEAPRSESATDEDNAWYYCIDTGVKLLPTFFEKLATGFHTQRYQEVLEEIKRERGQISNDGDRWIDKYSGYYICDIAYDTDEGYDAGGYKMVSRFIAEVSAVDKLIKIKDKEFNYKTKNAKIIQKILRSLDRTLHISTESEYAFVIKVTIDALNKYSLSEDVYNERQKKRVKAKAGFKKMLYDEYYDGQLMLSLTSAYIIAIQTSIPSITSYATFPNCKKSFSGFPLDGNTDNSFIEYMICILLRIRSDDRPWRAIPKAVTRKKREKKKYATIKEKFMEKLKKFMVDKILTFDSVKDKLENKKLWLKKNKTGEIIPVEFQVQKWSSFLPPLDPVSVTRIANIGHQFERMMLKTFETGNFEQFPHLWVLYGKITSFSFSILESVQRVINKENLILKTKTGIPFVENACCNEGNPNTFLYFSGKEASINKHNIIIYTLTDLYYKYKNMIRSPLFNFTKNTKIIFHPINKEFSNTTIYLAFIKFCKFNSGIILDDELSGICIKNECDYANTDSIERKVQIMRDNGLYYSNNTLTILLNIINARHILNYEIDLPVITEKTFLERTLDYLKEKNAPSLCHPNLLKHLKDVIDRYDIETSKKDEGKDEILTNFERYLTTITDELSTDIIEKMTENCTLKRRLQDIISENRKSTSRKEKFILNWKLRGDNIYMSRDDETGFEIFKLLKEMIINICKVYPNIILNKIDFKQRYVPKHWLGGSRKLSTKHKKDIEKIMMKEYADFTGFYDDSNIESVLHHVIENSSDLLRLLNSIPFYAGIDTEVESGSIFDGTIVKNLGYYFLLCALHIYMEASNEIDIIDVDDEETEEELILEGKKSALEKRVCSLLSVYLKKIQDYKQLLNKNNKDINDQVLKKKEKEKEKIKSNLKHLTIEEREVANIMKNHSLGEWGVGRTRAIYEYDENQYDKERNQQEEEALLDIKMALTESMGDTSTVEDRVWADKIQKRIDAEAYGLAGLPEDDDFGDRDDVDYA